MGTRKNEIRRGLIQGVLGPDEIRIMRLSYEKAVRNSPLVVSADPPDAQAQRDRIAKRIVGLMFEGERDVEVLSRKGAGELA